LRGRSFVGNGTKESYISGLKMKKIINEECILLKAGFCKQIAVEITVLMTVKLKTSRT
jgi:predicted nucleotidyltransferase